MYFTRWSILKPVPDLSVLLNNSSIGAIVIISDSLNFLNLSKWTNSPIELANCWTSKLNPADLCLHHGYCLHCDLFPSPTDPQMNWVYPWVRVGVVPGEGGTWSGSIGCVWGTSSLVDQDLYWSIAIFGYL